MTFYRADSPAPPASDTAWAAYIATVYAAAAKRGEDESAEGGHHA